MIIAIPYDNNNVFEHFGHTKEFKIYNVIDNNIIDSKIVPTNGKGHGALAVFLKENGVDILICGGIGEGAQSSLSSYNIKFYGGVKGACDEALLALLNNKLEYNPNITCSHHDHDDNHICGSCERTHLKRSL